MPRNDKKSNHPPNALNNIAGTVNDRLLGISSNMDIFIEAAKEYQEPLNKAGHKYDLKFNPTVNANASKSTGRRRTRKKIYFNAPFSIGVSTILGADFLKN